MQDFHLKERSTGLSGRQFLKGGIVAVGFLSVCSTLILLARSNVPTTSTFETLSDASVLELPQTAARLVSEAPPTDQSNTAREALLKVATLARPGVIPFAVSAICRAAPNTAAEAVTTAAELQSQDALFIAKAALSAAPAKTQEIVEAVCRQVPQAYPWVAVMAAEENNAAGPQILKGISSALSVLASPIERAQKYCPDGSMAELMQKTHELARAAYDEEVARLKRETIENVLQSQETSIAGESRDNEAPTPAGIEQGVGFNTTVRERLAALDRKAIQELMKTGLMPSSTSGMAYLPPPPALRTDAAARIGP
jgi:hypothetical protein